MPAVLVLMAASAWVQLPTPQASFDSTVQGYLEEGPGWFVLPSPVEYFDYSIEVTCLQALSYPME